MKNAELEEIGREVRQRLEEGRRKGLAEVEIMTQVLWKERQKRRALVAALDEIFRVAGTALDVERRSDQQAADVLEWRRPVQ